MDSVTMHIPRLSNMTFKHTRSFAHSVCLASENWEIHDRVSHYLYMEANLKCGL